MALSVAVPSGTSRQVGKEKTFSWDEESGLHVTNRVREYDFTPLKESTSDPAFPQSNMVAVSEGKEKATVSGAKDSSQTAKSAGGAVGRMRFGIVAGGVLALAVWKTVVEGKKRGRRKDERKDVPSGEVKGSIPSSPRLPTPSVTVENSFTATAGAQEANGTGSGEVLSTWNTATTPVRASSRVEDSEEWPEPGTPRSARTVSSAGGASLYSLSESQSQRLASHRKEVVVKLRQQLQSRDEMILDMQRQLASQEHFTMESKTIVQELEQQLKHAVETGQKLGVENQDLAEEVSRLGKEAEERARLAAENEELKKKVQSLEREGKERVSKLEKGRKGLDKERDTLRKTVEQQRNTIDGFEWEKARLQGKLREKEEALSEARAQLSSRGSALEEEETGPRMQALLKERERLVGELEKTKAEFERVKAESEARAVKERGAAERVGLVEKDLDRCQKILKGKDRLLEGYEKERVHLTAVLQDLEHKVESSKHELEVYQQSTAAATTEDVQSSNDSDGPRTMAGASPSRGEEVHSKARGPRSMQLMKSFDNPLSDMSPDTSPKSAGRPMSVSKPGRQYDSRIFDESVYPSPNGVLDNMQRRRSVDDQHSLLKLPPDADVARLSSDVDALARELSARFQTVTEKKLETGRLVADLQRHNKLIVDLQRKIGKESEVGTREEPWLANGARKEDGRAKQAVGPAQAAILAKKLEQVALQRQMDERLAEIQQQETEISRLKNRVASLGGKANGVQKVDPSEVFQSHSDVLGDELAHKLASQERQATEALTEVHRRSATFQRGSPLFAKAQDELVRRSLSSLDMKPGRSNSFGGPDGLRSAGEAHQRRYSATEGQLRASTGLGRLSSYSNGNHAALVGNGTQPEHENELARLTVEVERELSQDFGKRLDASGNAVQEMNGVDSPGSQGSGEMDLEDDGEGTGAESDADRKSENMDTMLAEMLESTLDDMVRMCTPATSQANSPFPSKRF